MSCLSWFVSLLAKTDVAIRFRWLAVASFVQMSRARLIDFNTNNCTCSFSSLERPSDRLFSSHSPCFWRSIYHKNANNLPRKVGRDINLFATMIRYTCSKLSRYMLDGTGNSLLCEGKKQEPTAGNDGPAERALWVFDCGEQRILTLL